MRLLLITLLTVATALVDPTTRYLDWSVDWKTVNPDGQKDRMVIAINDQWPLPPVRVNMGDRLIVNVTNNLNTPERTSTIHWHGLFMNGTNDMDGATMLTQCASGPNTSFVYNFTVDQPGTYWYHTHVSNLYPDGYRQLFLVDNDDAWFQDDVDDEIAFTLSDWYHDLTEFIDETEFFSLYNPTGAEPVPKTLLFNDEVAPRWQVQPNKTYRLRIANIGAFSGFYFYIPGYNFTVVEVDGIYTEPADAEMIYIAAAQRYSILFNTSSNPEEVYKMGQVADSSLYDVIDPDVQLNNTGFLYTGNPSDDQFSQLTNEEIFDTAPVWELTDNSEIAGVTDDLTADTFSSDNLHWFDDMELVPYDHMPLLEPVNVNHTLHLTMTPLYDGRPYALMNDISFLAPRVPTLMSVLSAPSDDVAQNVSIYGSNTNSIVLDHNDVVQIIMNNDDTGKHPFHMHGHAFQCIQRGPDQGQDTFVPYNATEDEGNYPEFPMRRDTFTLLPNSHFLIRFRADNPGIWFYHCHIEWHMSQGLALQLIEAPAQIRQNYKVHPLSDSHFDACKSVGVSTAGNAAGNSDFNNLNGENLQPKFLPSTFTARGIVALVFSIICAFVGMGFLCWYGTTDTPEGEAREAERVLQANVDLESFDSQTTNSNERYSEESNGPRGGTVEYTDGSTQPERRN